MIRAALARVLYRGRTCDLAAADWDSDAVASASEGITRRTESRQAKERFRSTQARRRARDAAQHARAVLRKQDAGEKGTR